MSEREEILWQEWLHLKQRYNAGVVCHLVEDFDTNSDRFISSLVEEESLEDKLLEVFKNIKNFKHKRSSHGATLLSERRSDRHYSPGCERNKEGR